MSYILDKAYSIDEPHGVPGYRVVVQGKHAGEAKIPRAQKYSALLGVTVHSQSQRGANVAVRKAGIARVMAADLIEVGQAVMISPNSGGKVMMVWQAIKPHELITRHVECLKISLGWRDIDLFFPDK